MFSREGKSWPGLFISLILLYKYELPLAKLDSNEVKKCIAKMINILTTEPSSSRQKYLMEWAPLVHFHAFLLKIYIDKSMELENKI